LTSHIGQYLNFILLVEPKHTLKAEDFWNKTKLKAFKYYIDQKEYSPNTISNKISSLIRVIIKFF
jgi:hypothetical protein